MTSTSPQDLIDTLDDLLDTERQAILDGNLENVADLITHKEALIEQLADIDVIEATHVTAIQTKLSRNHMLLDGALQGIRRAAARLAAVRKVRRSLETYSEDGQKTTIDAQVARQLERRA